MGREARQIEEDFDALSKRSFLIRRGRNNRLTLRPIMQNIFDEGPTFYEKRAWDASAIESQKYA